jgi:hypothetical protein
VVLKNEDGILLENCIRAYLRYLGGNELPRLRIDKYGDEFIEIDLAFYFENPIKFNNLFKKLGKSTYENLEINDSNFILIGEVKTNLFKTQGNSVTNNPVHLKMFQHEIVEVEYKILFPQYKNCNVIKTLLFNGTDPQELMSNNLIDHQNFKDHSLVYFNRSSLENMVTELGIYGLKVLISEKDNVIKKLAREKDEALEKLKEKDDLLRTLQEQLKLKIQTDN